jgi:hypothetical protein
VEIRRCLDAFQLKSRTGLPALGMSWRGRHEARRFDVHAILDQDAVRVDHGHAAVRCQHAVDLRGIDAVEPVETESFLPEPMLNECQLMARSGSIG